RRAVEPHPLGERSLELLPTDGEALQLAVDVGEPEANELDAVLLDPPQDVVRVGAWLGDRCHQWSFSFSGVLIRRGHGAAPRISHRPRRGLRNLGRGTRVGVILALRGAVSKSCRSYGYRSRKSLAGCRDFAPGRCADCRSRRKPGSKPGFWLRWARG